MKQRTIRDFFVLSGKGIHSNLPVRVTVRPAPENTGIIFRRVDQSPAVDIKADIANIREDRVLRQTVLSNGSVSVKTIEHLMSPLYAYGVTNAIVEIDQEELPGLDGGAFEYVQAIARVGVLEQNAPRPRLTIDKPMVFSFEGTDATMVLEPADHLRIDYALVHDSTDLSEQHYDLVVDERSYVKELAGARTFCLWHEAEYLRKNGFGKGATYQNTLVFKDNKPIENNLRYPNEAVRHKIVDLIGDFSLLGVEVCMHIKTRKTGHLQNVKVVKELHQLQEKRGDLLGKSQKEGCMTTGGQVDIVGIQNILPHRFPFLMVDRVLELEPGKRAVAIKNVTINEDFFNGHFPGHPVMPGVLMIEAMAQVGGIIMLGVPENKGKIAYFMSIDNVKFRRPVTPGDQLKFVVEVVKWKTRYGQCNGQAFVDDTLVAEAEMKFSLSD